MTNIRWWLIKGVTHTKPLLLTFSLVSLTDHWLHLFLAPPQIACLRNLLITSGVRFFKQATNLHSVTDTLIPVFSLDILIVWCYRASGHRPNWCLDKKGKGSCYTCNIYTYISDLSAVNYLNTYTKCTKFQIQSTIKEPMCSILAGFFWSKLNCKCSFIVLENNGCHRWQLYN